MKKYFLWIFFLRIASSMANDYCDLCKSHTMCEFKGQSPTCGKYVESGITAAEAEEIVFLHNLYRSKVANGSVICGSPGPQPPAANMNALTWDEDLAKVAQRWADQCNFDHDKCRRDARFRVGQNMYVNIGPITVDWRKAIKSWYSGVLKFNKSTVDSFQSNINTNSYTQLVWANTRYVGCGRTIFETTSNDQENSLKYDKFISSTINGSKNRTTNKQSDTDDAKITRQKRDYAEYFGEASLNENAARRALGPFDPIFTQQRDQMNQQSSVQGIQNQNYFSADQYDSQPTFYQQPFRSDIRYYYTNRQPQPEQQSYVHLYQPESKSYDPRNMASYSSDYSGHSDFLRSDESKALLAEQLLKAFGEFVDNEEAGSLEDENDSESQFEKRIMFHPRFGLVQYYGEKTPRIARSVNSEYFSDDDGDDIAYGRQEILEKKFRQQSPAQHTTLTRKQILVCNYGPTGNVIDQPIYIKGKLCSECLPNTTCKNGLCSYN
ncbi:uncharacterized protein [Chelonus insularis]|uniref:uncharacterized protein n=1 Tax=Chelonus insularis TaxID=460826 RepID=UPI00158E9157|nr:uncharacterized protein LOC118066333 [Chelonus insularis]